jgi:hypothetical protein
MPSMSHRDHELFEEVQRLARIFEGMAESLWGIDFSLQQIAGATPNKPQWAVKISQGGFNMAITGIPVGGQGTFEADAILNGTADAAGFPAGSVDVWTVDDALVTLGPDSGPNNSQVVASVAATDTAASFNLTVSVQMPTPAGGTAPAPLVMTVNVPITPGAVPVPTGVAITQVA